MRLRFAAFGWIKFARRLRYALPRTAAAREII